MRLFRFRLRTLMIAVAVVALYLGLLLTSPHAELLVLVTGPAIGAMAHRRWMNGRGIVGGIAGGVAECWANGIIIYLHMFSTKPSPDEVDYLGPMLSFGLLGCFGAGIGGVVGVCVWLVASLYACLRSEGPEPQ